MTFVEYCKSISEQPLDDGYPCKDCPVRKAFAEAFDIHMSGEDCMYECEIYENFKKNRDEEAGK